MITETKTVLQCFTESLKSRTYLYGHPNIEWHLCSDNNLNPTQYVRFSLGHSDGAYHIQYSYLANHRSIVCDVGTRRLSVAVKVMARKFQRVV